MLARFTRLPLRRCLHTQIPHSRTSKLIPVALGVSAVTATYITWHLLSAPIALDSHTTMSSLQEPTISSKPPLKATVALSSGSAPEKLPLPDSKLSSESSVSSQTSEQETDDKSEEETSEQPKEESEDSKSASGGAFNPETGEINWDCPCLGGMAHGPCGPEFREAFSCFVFSEQEPKGIDCVEKFQAMQECFRQHPEVYRDEIDDEEEAAKAVDEAGAEESTSTSSPTTVPSTPQDMLTTPTEPNTSS